MAWKGFVATNGSYIYSKMPVREGEEAIMTTAKTRKELFAKLDKKVREARAA